MNVLQIFNSPFGLQIHCTDWRQCVAKSRHLVRKFAKNSQSRMIIGQSEKKKNIKPHDRTTIFIVDLP